MPLQLRMDTLEQLITNLAKILPNHANQTFCGAHSLTRGANFTCQKMAQSLLNGNRNWPANALAANLINFATIELEEPNYDYKCLAESGK